MNGNDMVEHIESCENCMDLTDVVDSVKKLLGYESYNKEMNGDKLQKLIDDLESFVWDKQESCQTDTLVGEAEAICDSQKDEDFLASIESPKDE